MDGFKNQLEECGRLLLLLLLACVVQGQYHGVPAHITKGHLGPCKEHGCLISAPES